MAKVGVEFVLGCTQLPFLIDKGEALIVFGGGCGGKQRLINRCRCQLKMKLLLLLLLLVGWLYEQND